MIVWNEWPSETGDGVYPPDETPVLVRAKDAIGVWYIVSAISRRCGTYGPSFATHWALITDPESSEIQKSGKGL